MPTSDGVLTALAIFSLVSGLLGLLGALSVWRRPEVYAIELSHGQEFVLFLFATANLTLVAHAVLLLPRFPLDMATVVLNVLAILLLRFLNGLFITGLRWQAHVLNMCIAAVIIALAWQAGLEVPAWVPWPR